jgi:hypothetical protein
MFGIPPGCLGASRPEKRLTARSKAPPEEMNGTDLSREPAPEPNEDYLGPPERLKYKVDLSFVIATMYMV